MKLPNQHHNPHGGAVIRVALVDNHLLLTDLLKEFLDSMPRTEVLFTASNGRDMQDRIDAHGLPDVVLMDVRMPEMNGYLSVEWLRSYHPHVRIVVLTAFDDADMIARMSLHGVEGFLSKVDEHEQVYRAILEVADHGVYHNERLIMPSRFDPKLESLRGQLEQLKARKYEFLQHIGDDIDLNEAARRMDVSRSAVKRYTELLYEQYGVHSRHALVRRLFETGMFPIRPDGH